MTAATADRQQSVEQRMTDIYRRYWSPLMGAAICQTGNRELAQDAAQDTLIKAWQSLSKIHDDTYLMAWLRPVLKHQIYNHRTLSTVRERPVDSTAHVWTSADMDADAEQVDVDTVDAVADALLALPADVREVVLAFYVDGWTFHAIAEENGYRVDTTRRMCRAGLAALRAALNVDRPRRMEPPRPPRETGDRTCERPGCDELLPAERRRTRQYCSPRCRQAQRRAAMLASLRHSDAITQVSAPAPELTGEKTVTTTVGALASAYAAAGQRTHKPTGEKTVTTRGGGAGAYAAAGTTTKASRRITSPQLLTAGGTR